MIKSTTPQNASRNGYPIEIHSPFGDEASSESVELHQLGTSPANQTVRPLSTVSSNVSKAPPKNRSGLPSGLRPLQLSTPSGSDGNSGDRQPITRTPSLLRQSAQQAQSPDNVPTGQNFNPTSDRDVTPSQLEGGQPGEPEATEPSATANPGLFAQFKTLAMSDTTQKLVPYAIGALVIGGLIQNGQTRSLLKSALSGD